MRISCKWLKAYVDYSFTPQELADALTMSGSEVDTVESLAPDFSGVITALVESAEPHPDADKLKVCQVNTGTETVQVVCGAPNVAAGQIVPFATVGAVLPGGFKIKKAKLRGVVSNGMICSERELGLSEDHEGIMVLPESLDLGVSIQEALGLDDSVLELDIYPNRPDNLSIVGIAREVAAICGSPLKMPEVQLGEGEAPIERMTSVTVEAPDLCPRYACRVISGVKIGESPLWLQQRLRSAGMRPINNVVDVTNFVMLELGQPLHAFDYDLLSENRIVVRRATSGETITTLDGQHRQLSEDMLVIADAEKAQVVAGVMGAQTSEVSEQTVNILLESANFYGPSIRRTSRELGLRSEASQRFEKGLDPNGVRLALDRAAALIAELTGGEIAKGLVDAYPEPVASREIQLRLPQVKRLLGVEIAGEECAAYLNHLQFNAELSGDIIRVEVPTFRADVEREADLIEEIGRLYGFDNIPATLPAGSGTPGGKQPALEFQDALREVMIGFGLNEVMTYTFGTPKSLERVLIPQSDPARSVIEIRNPLSEDWGAMRSFVVPHLLEVLERNIARQQGDVHVFEVGPVYQAESLPLTKQPKELRVLAMAMTGQWPDTAWGRTASEVDVFDVKGILDEMAAAFGLTFTWKQSQHPSLHPGRTADVYCQGEKIGVMGEIHPKVAQNYSIPLRTVVAEIQLGTLISQVNLVKRAKALPRFPAVDRDLALLVPIEVTGESIERVMWDSGSGLVQSIRLFDVYQGKQIPDGYKSLAFTLRFQAPDRTLRDEEIQEVVDKIQEQLTELKVKVRM